MESASTGTSAYLHLKITDLKEELKKRGATTRGRKADLIERYSMIQQMMEITRNRINILCCADDI